MAKPEWGTKRICLSCGARFYDLLRSPILCPSCNATFDVEAASRTKRPRAIGRVIPDDVVDPVVGDVAVAGDEIAEEAEVEESVEIDDAEIEPDKVADDDEDALIEDTADLGEDEDMSDVIADDLDGDSERH